MKKSNVSADEYTSTSNLSVIGQFDGKCADSIENNNSMTLPTELWKKLFDSEEFKHFIELGHYIGFLGHPEDPGCQDFKNACIIMREGHVNDDGSVEGKFDLIDTPVGRIVKTLIDAGVTFGISVRGVGDVEADGYVDPDTFTFRGFDLVAFPAYDDAIPTFIEIAASSDPSKKKKYQAVCAAIKTEIPNIDDERTLDVLGSQFNENSNQYKIIASKKASLHQSLDLTKQKLEAMTNLYLESLSSKNSVEASYKSKIRDLESQLYRLKREGRSTRRIMTSQFTSCQKSLEDMRSQYATVVSANTKLKSTVEQLHDRNLKYKQKINADRQVIAHQEGVIASLKSEAQKTVQASRYLKKKASNFDEKIAKLENEIAASRKLIESYQDAYANLYANILGVHVDSATVTASTTVDELKNIVESGTSTSNIAPAASITDTHDVEEVDIVDPEGLDDMVTL